MGQKDSTTGHSTPTLSTDSWWSTDWLWGEEEEQQHQQGPAPHPDQLAQAAIHEHHGNAEALAAIQSGGGDT